MVNKTTGINKGKTPAQMEWIQKDRRIHTLAITNAMVLYTAPIISTSNSCAALNCNMPDGIYHVDIQDDLLARVAMNMQPIITSPRDSLDSPKNQQEQCYDTGMDGATASEAEEETIENFTNDLIPQDAATKMAKGRGRPKKRESIRKPPILPSITLAVKFRFLKQPLWPLLQLIQTF